MKNLLTNSAKALISIIVSASITAWITGQPLIGLTKLKGLYDTFIQSSVPAWAFAIVFLIALFGIQYALTHLPKRRPRGQVHFVPDAHNCGWSKQTDTDMNVRIGGTLTYEGTDTLIVLKAFLKGTKPITDMVAQVRAADGSGRNIVASEFRLPSGLAIRVLIDLHLTPMLGTPGQLLRHQLVFRDKYNRDFPLGLIDFPYIGR